MLKALNGLSITVRGATQARVISVPKVSGYNIFVKDAAKAATEPIRKETMAKFSKDASIKWKALSPAEKESYVKRSKEMNEKAMEEYHKLSKVMMKMQLIQEKQEKLETAARDGKKALARKRELRERIAQTTKKNSREESNAFLASVAKEWKDMSAEAKYKYTKESEKEMEVYTTEVAKWKATHPTHNTNKKSAEKHN